MLWLLFMEFIHCCFVFFHPGLICQNVSMSHCLLVGHGAAYLIKNPNSLLHGDSCLYQQPLVYYTGLYNAPALTQKVSTSLKMLLI